MVRLDESKNYNTAELLREMKHSQDTMNGNGHLIEDYSTFVLPVINIDQLHTEGNLSSIKKASPSSWTWDDLPIEEQTWILPVVPTSSIGIKFEAQGAGAEGYVSFVRKLVKNSGIYALSSLASPLIALILAPFLTHVLSPTEYGAFAVLTTIISLMTAVTQFGLNSAFFRAYNADYESQRDRLDIVSTVALLIAFTSIPISIAAVMTAPWLAELFFKSPSFSNAVRLTALVVLLQNLTLPGFSWLRAEGRAVYFSVLSIVNLLVTLGATIVLVGMLHMGIAGAIIGIAGGYGTVVIYILPIIFLRSRLRFRFDIAWNLLSFGLPAVPTYVSVWILQLSDRYLLSHLGSLAQTGSYNVAYTLGGALAPVVIAPFSLAWFPALYAIAKRDDGARIFRLIFRWYSIVMLFAVFALSLIATVALDLLYPSSYHSVAAIIPIIAVSTMFYGVYHVFTVGVYVRRKTWLTVIFTTIAALVNVGLNLVLIPPYGSMGAAVATLIAYTLLALIAYVANQRIYPITFDIGMFIIALAVGIALYLGSGLLAENQGIYEECAIYIGTLFIYGGGLILLERLVRRSPEFRDRQAKEKYVV